MCGVIALIVLGLPLVEIFLIVQIGGQLGALATIGMLLVTALVGSVLARRAGLSTLRELGESAAAGRPMAPVVAEGALLALAGVFFMIPGFLSDAVAIALLVPALRRRLARRLVLRTGVVSARPTTESFIDVSAVERSDQHIPKVSVIDLGEPPADPRANPGADDDGER